jgi:Icc protein
MTDIAPNTAQAVRVLHITDFHLLAERGRTMLGVDTEQTLADVLDAALGSGPPPDLALLTGDLVQDAVAPAYRRLRTQLARLPCPAYCLPGNHDDPELIAMALADGQVRFQPQILLDHWQIICLDSTLPRQPYGRLGETQLALLESLLADQPQRHALIALHHHPLPSGSAWMDTMLLEDADPLFAILERHPQAKTLVCGHVHQALELSRDGRRLFATPSTCFQFKPQQADFALDPVPPGYRWIELFPDGRIATTLERLPRTPAGLDLSSRGY